VFYIFHGDDEFGCGEELARLRAKLSGGDPAMAEMNTTILDGAQATLGEIRHACDTIPFLSDRRLVVVHGLLSRLSPGQRGRAADTADGDEPAWRRTFVTELAAYLPSLPPSTRLVFVERSALQASHPILKVAETQAQQNQAFVRLFSLPKERDLGGWIRQRVTGKGGSIRPEASELLAQTVGRDLRLLDQEIDKLLVYADGQTIGADDVRLLVSRARETSVFDLVDSLGRRQTARALELLHRLLDAGEAPLYLLTMLVRQVRILIQVSELRQQGLSAQEMAAELGLHPFVVEKGLDQARNFDLAQLEAAHRRLVETDWSIKTGTIEEVLALDLLVVDLASR
jgi:DNA polymerase-3 subunit delta